MKKNVIFILIVALVFIYSCANPDVSNSPKQTTSTINVDNASKSVTTGDEVSLYKGSAFVQTKYYAQYLRTYDVIVKNLGSNKKVYIHHKTVSGTWTDLECTYIRNVNSNFELWRVENSALYNPTLDNQFAVKYVVNGVTYWDNNNGTDYILNANDGIILGKNINVLSNDVGYIDVRNLSYNKNIEIIYSTDNWKTVKTVNASYVSEYSFGYTTIKSPNAVGTERWRYNFPESGAKYFAIKYTVNGTTYWDNNFGANYYSSY